MSPQKGRRGEGRSAVIEKAFQFQLHDGKPWRETRRPRHERAPLRFLCAFWIRYRSCDVRYLLILLTSPS
jgi:hypothetical protein